MRTYLTNARIVLADRVLASASLLIEDGQIAAIDPLDPQADSELNLGGALLLPGLIDLHCDGLEKEVEPRAGVRFPLPLAVAAADRRNASCGITTVFHAVAFADGELGVRSTAVAAELVNEIVGQRPFTLVDNRVHARYELSDERSAPALERLLGSGQISALSLMDHTPGQGQFKSVEAYQAYLGRAYRIEAGSAAALIADKRERAADGLERAAGLAALARARGITLLSHDDDSPERVATMAALGVSASEFPLNLATAQAAVAQGIATLVGAPNLLRGQSQSGGLRAIDAIQAEVATCICSDYAATTLLPAVLELPQLAGISLAQAVQLATRNPARVSGLLDRGELRPGLRADLIAVRGSSLRAHVVGVWVAGRARLVDTTAFA